MNEETRNMILAMALSTLVMLVWFVYFAETPDPNAPQPGQETAQTSGGLSVPTAEGSASVPNLAGDTIGTRDAALAASPRIAIRTPRLEGSFSLRGGRIDDLRLLDYNVRLNDPSERVTLLSPAGGPQAYYTVHGWAPGRGYSHENVPNGLTEWTLEDGDELTPETPIKLIWDNGIGLIFRRTISVDNDYMFSITQSVENTTDTEVRLQPYGTIARTGEPDVIGFYILHEGVVRASDGELQEIDYDDMPDQEFSDVERANVDKIKVEQNGWVGFTDKFWMTTLIPNPGQAFTSVSKYTTSIDTYQTEIRLPLMAVAPGTTATVDTSLFAGAKEWESIRRYERENGVAQFIDSIDWGWFFFLTKPIFQVLHFFNQWIGNMGWAIICLTLFIKALLFPLAYRSYVSMARMKELQPEMEKLKERVGDDRQKMQQEMMKLYREKKVNPAAGCLPILLQIPIFFSLYKVIFVTIEMRHAPFIWWIQDLSAPDPTSFLNLFGLLPWGTPEVGTLLGIFSIGVFPILMGVTMWLQQKLNPAPTDPTQQMIFAWMPWVFMFMLGTFEAGLVIYWVANNTITFIQQYAIMWSQGVKPDVFGNIREGFKRMRKSEE